MVKNAISFLGLLGQLGNLQELSGFLCHGAVLNCERLAYLRGLLWRPPGVDPHRPAAGDVCSRVEGGSNGAGLRRGRRWRRGPRRRRGSGAGAACGSAVAVLHHPRFVAAAPGAQVSARVVSTCIHGRCMRCGRYGVGQSQAILRGCEPQTPMCTSRVQAVSTCQRVSR